MMHGFYGSILKIDMTKQTHVTESMDDDIPAAYLGGKGLASYLLYNLNPPGIDPLDPANCLIFATGPAAGSSIWGSCRYGMFTKSPQTGFYSESYSGGKVPEAVDRVGFDAIVIQGKSREPVVLGIFPDRVVFHPADDIWGMETYQAEDEVKSRFSETDTGLGKPGAVVIGPAGENLVRFAVAENDYWRSAGRTGVGTVMGAKNAKAILFQGACKRPVFAQEKVKKMA